MKSAAERKRNREQSALTAVFSAPETDALEPIEAQEDSVSTETILIWMAIGLVAGWLASVAVGGGYGVIGDIVLGIVGAFLGGLIFRAMHLQCRSVAWRPRSSSPSWGGRPVAPHASRTADLRARQIARRPILIWIGPQSPAL